MSYRTIVSGYGCGRLLSGRPYRRGSGDSAGASADVNRKSTAICFCESPGPMSFRARARNRTCRSSIPGTNAADTIENAGNRNHTNGTPITILIPNLDRHFVHVKQYQDTNRTPRPGHASYASFVKYGPDDDAIGAGIFSGRYTSHDRCRRIRGQEGPPEVRHRGLCDTSAKSRASAARTWTTNRP